MHNKSYFLPLAIQKLKLKSPIRQKNYSFFIKTKRKLNVLTLNMRIKKDNILYFSPLLLLKLKIIFCQRMSHMSKTNFKFFKFLRDSCKIYWAMFKNYFFSFVNENSTKQPEDYAHLERNYVKKREI